jgi:hypothetical protein
LTQSITGLGLLLLLVESRLQRVKSPKFIERERKRTCIYKLHRTQINVVSAQTQLTLHAFYIYTSIQYNRSIYEVNYESCYLAGHIIDLSALEVRVVEEGLRQPLLQAGDGRDGGCLLRPVRAPAEGVVDELAAEGQELDLGHGDVGAGHGVAAGEVDGRAAGIVGSPDVGVGDVGDVHGRGLVHAPLVQAVVLVHDDAVAHVLHGHRVEGDARHGAHPALPRLDPQAVVRVPDHRVPDRHVRHARLRVVHAEAADAAMSSRIPVSVFVKERRRKNRGRERSRGLLY